MGLSLFAFLPPLGALLACIAAISVPILIHLLSRRRYKVVTWAAMRFLLAAVKQNLLVACPAIYLTGYL